jgi:hypothetical protein
VLFIVVFVSQKIVICFAVVVVVVFQNLLNAFVLPELDFMKFN